MDIFSIVGLLLALVGVIGGVVLDGGQANTLLQLTAFMIVVLGSLGATLLSTLPSDMPFALASLKRVFRPRKYDFTGLMEQMVDLAKVARREGLLALESYTNSGKGDPFLARCLALAVDGTSAEAIRETVEIDMQIQEEDDRAGLKFWETWGVLAPTIGVLGAVLALMHVMNVLDQPSLLGPGIALAFVSTVYGVGFAHIVCLPMAFKLRRHIEHDQLLKLMVLEGVVCIQSGMAPSAVRRKLHVYLGARAARGAKKRDRAVAE